MYIISKCLLGCNCKYNGGNNLNEAVVEFSKSHTCISICPESLGGLSSPRCPAEIVEDECGLRVVDKDGKNVTENFLKGSNKAISQVLAEAKAKGEKIEGAILKANSPSCGVSQIYDGSFTGALREGDGVMVRLLKNETDDAISDRMTFFTEMDVDKL